MRAEGKEQLKMTYIFTFGCLVNVWLHQRRVGRRKRLYVSACVCAYVCLYVSTYPHVGELQGRKG